MASWQPNNSVNINNEKNTFNIFRFNKMGSARFEPKINGIGERGVGQ